MKPFTVHKGIAAPMDRANIDTDMIIPKQFLKSIKRSGFGPNLFDELRYLDEGQPDADNSGRPLNPDFVLNQPRYQGASVLLARENFGCGSSREHAPQSLKRWGIKAIVAESYSEIFYGNCVSLAVPCFTADHATCAKLQDAIESDPASEIVVSVGESTIMVAGETITLEIQSGAQGQFLDGSWNARAGLLENLDGVREVAVKLPYVSNYA